MRGMLIGRAVTVSLLVWAVAAVGSLEALAAGLPASPVSLNGGLRIAPGEIVTSEDGNAFIVGPWAGTYHGWRGAPKHFPAIDWTRWSTASAVGTGAWVAGNCKPSCFQGTFSAYPVRLREWRPRTVHGRWIFTRLQVTYSGSVPAHTSRSVIVTARYFPGPKLWGWG